MQGQTHEINPETDLIPVCPNCHAMLHRKIDGIYLTPKQLKDGLSNVWRLRFFNNSTGFDGSVDFDYNENTGEPNVFDEEDEIIDELNDCDQIHNQSWIINTYIIW